MVCLKQRSLRIVFFRQHGSINVLHSVKLYIKFMKNAKMDNKKMT